MISITKAIGTAADTEIVQAAIDGFRAWGPSVNLVSIEGIGTGGTGAGYREVVPLARR